MLPTGNEVFIIVIITVVIIVIIKYYSPGRMHRQTGEKFVDPTAMSRQMREVSDF